MVAPALSLQASHGNPACAAAGLAVLETIRRDDLAATAGAVGGRLMQELQALKQKHTFIGDVRCLRMCDISEGPLSRTSMPLRTTAKARSGMSAPRR